MRSVEILKGANDAVQATAGADQQHSYLQNTHQGVAEQTASGTAAADVTAEAPKITEASAATGSETVATAPRAPDEPPPAVSGATASGSPSDTTTPSPAGNVPPGDETPSNATMSVSANPPLTSGEAQEHVDRVAGGSCGQRRRYVCTCPAGREHRDDAHRQPGCFDVCRKRVRTRRQPGLPSLAGRLRKTRVGGTVVARLTAVRRRRRRYIHVFADRRCFRKLRSRRQRVARQSRRDDRLSKRLPRIR